jgi:hypothetical protein
LSACGPQQLNLCNIAIATHFFNPLTGSAVCQTQSAGLRFCDDERYFCVITNGNFAGPPFDDAFVEWYYTVDTNTIAPSYVTGKLTFSAPAAYIEYWYTVNGNQYLGPGAFGGIPMFCQSNHNFN